MPAASGPPWSAVEYTSTHPHDVRLRRAQSGGNEVGVRCKTKPRPWGQITTGAVRLLRIGRGCLARRAIVARIGLVIGKQKALHRNLHANSCSWFNAVESFFARLSRHRLKRGVFRSIVDLQAAINRFLAETNAEPKPFTWTADPDKIIAAVRRGHQALDSIH